MEDIRTDTVDELMESLAEAYVDSKAWAKAHGYGDVHLVKTHYKDLQDGIWKDCWNIVWDNDEGRIAFMDECAANFFSEGIVKVVVNESK